MNLNPNPISQTIELEPNQGVTTENRALLYWDVLFFPKLTAFNAPTLRHPFLNIPTSIPPVSPSA
jgi:hypothetical protein